MMIYEDIYCLIYAKNQPLNVLNVIVCVWDRKVKPYFVLNRSRNICNDCWYTNYNGPGCKIS